MRDGFNEFSQKTHDESTFAWRSVSGLLSVGCDSKGAVRVSACRSGQSIVLAAGDVDAVPTAEIEAAANALVTACSIRRRIEEEDGRRGTGVEK
jgi:hypothetical protein